MCQRGQTTVTSFRKKTIIGSLLHAKFDLFDALPSVVFGSFDNVLCSNPFCLAVALRTILQAVNVCQDVM